MNNIDLSETITRLEEETGVKVGFFNDLLQEDDWSFIIKIHALYEAAISNLISKVLGKTELEDFISKLELGDKYRGKLRLSKELNLLDPAERKFIHALSEIRNNFVHNVKNTTVTLEQYFQNSSKDKQKNYINTFGYSYPEFIEIAGKKVNSKVFTKENPKVAIWHNSLHVLALISLSIATEKTQQSINQIIHELHGFK